MTMAADTDPSSISTHPRTHRFAASSSSTNKTQQQHQQSYYFLWLSDIHLDPNYSTPSAYRYPDGRYDATANCTSANASTLKTFGMHGCDSPLALVRSTLDAVVNYISLQQQQQQQPDFILVTGDVVRHGTNDVDSARQILSTLADELTTKFPNVEIIYAVGNNDVVPDYYLRLPSDDEPPSASGGSGQEEEEGGGSDESGGGDEHQGDEFVTTTVNNKNNVDMLEVIYKSLMKKESSLDTDTTTNASTTTTTTKTTSPRNAKTILTSDDRNTFLTGGYYSRYLHSDGSLLVLSMNTVLYSAILEPARKSDDTDPGGQFSWMRSVLASCRNSNIDSDGGAGGSGCRAIIAGHIPPTVGSYKFNQLWKKEYVRTYYDIVQEFDEIIIAQLFGHLHTDEFRVGGIFADDENNSNNKNDEDSISTIPSSLSTPLLLGASVSPLHGNDPSFRIVKYDRGDGKHGNRHRLVDYESHALSLITKTWSKLYAFSEAYGDVVSSDMLKKEGLSSTVFRTVARSMEDDIIKGEGASSSEKLSKEESSIMKKYRTFMLSGAEGDAFNRGANVDCDSECRDEFACTLQAATRAGYDTCLLGRKELRRAELMGKEEGLAGLVVAGVVVIAVIGMAFVRCKKRQSLRAEYDSPPSVHEDEGDIDLKDKEMI